MEQTKSLRAGLPWRTFALVRDMVKGDLKHGFFAEKITAYWFEKSYDQMGDLTRRLGIAEEEERQVFRENRI